MNDTVMNTLDIYLCDQIWTLSKNKSLGVPWWLSSYGFSVVTAVARVQFLDQELLDAMGAAKKKKKEKKKKIPRIGISGSKTMGKSKVYQEGS